MEYMGTEVNKKRFSYNPSDFTQVMEAAFYIASKRKIPVHLFQVKEEDKYTITCGEVPKKTYSHYVMLNDGKLYKTATNPKEAYEVKKAAKRKTKSKIDVAAAIFAAQTIDFAEPMDEDMI